MSFRLFPRFGSYALLVACLFACVALPAHVNAQDRSHGKAPSKQSARKANANRVSRTHETKRTSKTEASSSTTSQAVVQPTPSPSNGEGKAPASAPNVDANKPVVSSDAAEDVRKEGGSEVKVVEFTGLDIEGNLKTPQMLYFLNRLRAEFGRPRLPHRSFLPELDLSTKEKAF